MPQIREYTSRVESSGPADTRRAPSEAFGTQEAQARGNFSRAIDSVGDILMKRAEQSEVSDLTAKMAEAHVTFTKRLRERLRTADPGDQTIVETFQQEFDDHIGKLSEGISTGSGHEYFARASSQLKTHFLESAAAGQAELAGVKAVQDYSGVLTNFSSALVNDPSSFELTRQMHGDTINALVAKGLLSTQQATKFKVEGETQLAKSALRGWIDTNPAHAKQQLDSGKWNSLINGDAKVQLYGEIDQEIRGRELEAERLRREQERQRQEAQKATQNNLLQKLADGTLGKDDIMKSDLDPFGSGSKEQFLGLLKSRSDGINNTEPATFRELMRRIYLPDGDPSKIIDENQLNDYVIRGQLGYSDLNHLRDEIQGKKTAEGRETHEMKERLWKMAESKLVKANPMLGISDPDGLANMQRFTIYALREYKTQKAAGKTDMQLLNPDSPDFLGKYIGQFAKTPDQIMNDMVRGLNQPLAAPAPSAAPSPSATPQTNPDAAPTLNMAPTPQVTPSGKPARLPNESPADYLKRIKGGS